MKIINLEQNSDAWLQWRHSGIGSSDAPAILELSPWSSRYDLWEEKVYQYHKAKGTLTGKQMEIITEKMRAKEMQNDSSKRRGKKLEPVAREMYEAYMGYKVPDTCGVHDKYEFMKVSLDGWNEDLQRFVEIKAPNQQAHGVALEGMVPDYYMPQLLHQFVVSGGTSCDYISYYDKMPPGHRLAIVRVNSNTAKKTLGIHMELEEAIDNMIRIEKDFWESVIENEYKDLR